MYQSTDYDYLLTSKKQLTAFNFFWIGFVIYTLVFTLFATSFTTNFKYVQVGQGFGAFILVLAAAFLIHLKIENLYLKIVSTLYLIWLIGVVARGFHLNYQYLNNVLFDDYNGIFPYFTPLLLLFPQKITL